MTSDDQLSTELNYAGLVDSINKLTAALNQHTKELQNHKNEIGDLEKAIERLDSTIRNVSDLRASPVSPQLKSVIVEFVENYINPRFYPVSMYKSISGHPGVVRASLPSGRN